MMCHLTGSKHFWVAERVKRCVWIRIGMAVHSWQIHAFSCQVFHRVLFASLSCRRSGDCFGGLLGSALLYNEAALGYL